MSTRRMLIFPIFVVLLVFFMFSNNAYASSSYEIGPGDPNQDCEKLGGSFVSGISFECDVGTSFTLSTGDSITIDPKTRLSIIGGGTLDVNGGTITIKNGVVFGNLATFGGTININNGGIIDIFGSMVDFHGTIDNIGGTITNENGAIISANGGTITNEASGTFINTSGSDINIQGGAVINMCGAFINNGQVNGGTIENQCSTATTLSSLHNPSTSGQSVTFTATVAPSSGTIPDGETITFYENGTSVGTSITSAGSASFATALANTGSYSIIAIYHGDNSFPSSTSNAVLQTVTNTPPVANSDSYTINENTELFVPALTGVLSNDKDSDGDVLIVSLTTGPTHGSMMLNSNGSLTYTPNSDFVGSDSFVYQADDGHGNTASSTDTIIVNQIVCPAGSFLSSGDNTCTPAPAGSYVSSTGSTSAALCPAGTYSDTTGNTACTPASAGSFVDTTGATSAALCPVGTFADTTGQSACTPAPAGSYVSSTGSTSAALCLAGTYQPNMGQISCIPASPGFYVSTTGEIQQTQCPAGTTSDISGSTSCHAVSTVGKVTGGGNIGKDQDFGFEVSSKDGTTFKGHVEYHAKTSNADIESTTITQLFVDSSMTHAIFVGQALTSDDHHDDDKKKTNPTSTFLINVSDLDKTGNHDTFSITVTNSTGNITYQNSGTVKGHIEIHNIDTDDNGSHNDDHDKNSK